MKKATFFGLFALAISASAFATEGGKVAITVSGSPCTGGPTNCISLAQGNGTIVISSVNGQTTEVAIAPSGLTFTTLAPGAYKFSFKSKSHIGSSEVIDQDIVNL